MKKRKYIIFGIIILIIVFCFAFCGSGLKKKKPDKKDVNSKNSGPVFVDPKDSDGEDGEFSEDKKEQQGENQTTVEKLFGSEDDSVKDNDAKAGKESNSSDNTEMKKSETEGLKNGVEKDDEETPKWGALF